MCCGIFPVHLQSFLSVPQAVLRLHAAWTMPHAQHSPGVQAVRVVAAGCVMLAHHFALYLNRDVLMSFPGAQAWPCHAYTAIHSTLNRADRGVSYCVMRRESRGPCPQRPVLHHPVSLGQQDAAA
jgi:hypothetical protein